MDKKIKINYVGFWKTYNYENLTIHQILKKHYDLEISDNPDYLICSCFDNRHYNYPNTVKIFYTGENISTDFNTYDYGLDFDDYEFFDRHYRMPVYIFNSEQIEIMHQMLEKHLHAEESFKEKDAFCSFVYSHDVQFRNEFFDELSKYKQVDAGGKSRNNVQIGPGQQDKVIFEKRHKFAIAFENMSRRGYITEKLVNSFATGTIPIYWGAVNVDKYFNPKAMIHIKSPDDIPQAIARIKELDQNDDLYMEMLKQPACLPEQQKYHEELVSNLEKFLCHIFDQPLNKAGRRNYNQNYVDILKKPPVPVEVKQGDTRGLFTRIKVFLKSFH